MMVTTNVEFTVDENGNVEMPKVIKSSDYKNVDNDALQIIAKIHNWKNAIQNNHPVNAY
ncbi:MAG: TonB family protein [Ginsengibacter sp.]